MTLLATLALVQIVGFSGFAIAQEPVQGQAENSRLIHEVKNFFNNFNYMKYEFLVSNDTGTERMKCESNGGPKAFDTSLESLRIYLNSFNVLTNTTQRELEAAADQPENGLNTAIKTVCRWATKTNDLSITWADSLKSCWTPAERNSVELLNNVSTTVLEYICQNEGSRISSFLTVDHNQHQRSMIEISELERCARTSFIGYVSPIESYDRTLLFPWSVPVIVLKTENCLEFENFQRCVVTVLRGHEQTTLPNKVDSLFNVVKESSGCGTLLIARTNPTTDTN